MTNSPDLSSSIAIRVLRRINLGPQPPVSPRYQPRPPVSASTQTYYPREPKKESPRHRFVSMSERRSVRNPSDLRRFSDMDISAIRCASTNYSASFSEPDWFTDDDLGEDEPSEALPVVPVWVPPSFSDEEPESQVQITYAQSNETSPICSQRSSFASLF